MKILPIFFSITVVYSFGFVRKHPRDVRKVEENQSCSEEEEVRGNQDQDCEEEEVKSTRKHVTKKPIATRKPSTTTKKTSTTTRTKSTTPKPTTTSTTTTTPKPTTTSTTIKTEPTTTTTPKPTTVSTTEDPLRNPSTPFNPENPGSIPDLSFDPADNTEDVAIENTQQLRKPDSPLNPSKVNSIPDLGFGISRDEGLGGAGNLQNTFGSPRLGFSVELSTPKPVVLPNRL